jgi:multidrug resistance efflux pump
VIVGRPVTRGQVLAQIAPPVNAPSDRTALEVAKTEAENSLAFARRDRERAQRLVEAGAVPARRLEEARLNETTIEIRLKAAESRLAQYEASRGAEADGGSRLFAVRAPMAGTIAESHAVSGANVRAGDVLFRIIDTESVYVSANVPEAELVRLRQVTGAEYRYQMGLPSL